MPNLANNCTYTGVQFFSVPNNANTYIPFTNFINSASNGIS